MRKRAGMPDDERAIRELVQTWLAATQDGGLQTVLGLMADDVIFMVPGQNPLGKEAFAASFKGLNDVRFDTSSDIKEIKLLCDWAYLRNYLEVTMTPRDGGAPVRQSGYTLTILRKEPDGRWLLARDANLLAPQT
ncbi:MAG: SgcJ/EcaC family oxidoreductase [Methylocella sp.]